MTSSSAPFLRVLLTVLFCLAMTGAVDAAASDGPVICWGSDGDGRATPPDAVNGVSGTATDIAAGYGHSCAIQAGTGNAVCWGDDSDDQATPPTPSTAFRAPRPTLIDGLQCTSCSPDALRKSRTQDIP